MNTITCPSCKKYLLIEVDNSYDGEIFQRVVTCQHCGYVYSFNAPEDWREKIRKLEKRAKRKQWFKFLWLYIRYRKEINAFYSFSLKGKYGEQVEEGLNWYSRTRYWWLSE